MYFDALKCILMHWNAFWCTEIHFNALKCILMHWNVLWCTALKCILVHCKAMQCALKCSAVQFDSMLFNAIHAIWEYGRGSKMHRTSHITECNPLFYGVLLHKNTFHRIAVKYNALQCSALQRDFEWGLDWGLMAGPDLYSRQAQRNLSQNYVFLILYFLFLYLRILYLIWRKMPVHDLFLLQTNQNYYMNGIHCSV